MNRYSFMYVYYINVIVLALHVALAFAEQDTISALGTYRIHCHLCYIRYSFTPELIEARECLAR